MNKQSNIVQNRQFNENLRTTMPTALAAASIKGAQLSWTTEAEADENTVTNPDDQPAQGGEGSSSEGGNGGIE